MFQKNRVPVESLLGAGAIDCWAGLLGIAGGDLFHHQPGRREVCDKGCASMPVAQCAIINLCASVASGSGLTFSFCTPITFSHEACSAGLS